MKNGFTLIELLAVIVILAIIALIAAPIVLKIIGDTKDSATISSAEFYNDAVELAIPRYIAKGGVVESGTYEVLENGNLCLKEDTEADEDELCDEELLVDITGEKPNTGSTVTIENGKVKDVLLKYNTDTIVKENEKLVYDDSNEKEEENIPEPKSFAEDSWDTIAANVRKGNIDVYKSNLENNKNNTKKIELTIDGTKKEYTVRIANTTTPPECNSEGFSQTACGFVVEFVDIITTHNMNPSGEYKGVQYDYGWNKDGYPASSMYKFLNDETDKEITSIYELLPEEIKNVIIPTFVVSSYGSEDTSNFTSTDKLYLLSTKELYGAAATYDTVVNETRQLDYYIQNGVTTENSKRAPAIKKYNGTATTYWLRSARSSNTGSFYRVSIGGVWGSDYASYTYGVAPAFRIG